MYDIQIISEYSHTTNFIELIFNGGCYKITYDKYTNCINITEILYICDNLNRNKIENIVLNKYETEYKQLCEIIKRRILK